jgi:type II secretory pathway component PulC
MKIKLSRLRPITVGLLALNVGLAATLIALAWNGTRTDKLLATPARDVKVVLGAIDLPTPSIDVASIQDAALFHASRRFYVAPPPSTVPVAPPRPDYRLAGTFVVPNKPTVAWLMSNATQQSLRVKVGESVGGWTVQGIEKGRVVLQYENETMQIGDPARPASGGLNVVPMKRTTIATATGVKVLGNSGTTNSSSPSIAPSVPVSGDARLYRPPPR